MRARRSGGVSRQAGKAAFAALTAAAMSASLQKGTWRTISPVAGFVTLPERELEAPCLRPFTQSARRSIAFMSVGLFILSPGERGCADPDNGKIPPICDSERAVLHTARETFYLR